METEQSHHYATVLNQTAKEVRHLVIEFMDGSRETRLLLICGGRETLISTGSEFESCQKAQELIQGWAKSEGFRCMRKDEQAWEPLSHVIALAARLGYTGLYDPAFVDKRWPQMNFFGEVALASWPGLKAKNGGSYLYALDGMRLCANPILPKGSVTDPAPSGSQELASYLSHVIAKVKEVGSFREFILTDRPIARCA